MNEKNIPLRNYILLSIILIISVVLVIYFYMWYGTYEDNKIYTPILDEYLTVINYNELEDYLIENKDAIIYVSILGDEEIRTFEKKFKKFFIENSVDNNILYLDLTSEYKDNNVFNNIKIKYGLKSLPCIIIFRDGVVYNSYNIKDYNYDINNIINFLDNAGVMYD